MKRITKESLYELKSLAQPCLSSKYALFLETSVKEEEYESKIVGINLKTKEKVFFGDNANHQNLQVKDDVIYYLSNDNKDKTMQLCKMNLNGGKSITLTNEKNGVQNYCLVNDTYYYTTFLKPEEDKRLVPTYIDKITYKNDGKGMLNFNITYYLKNEKSNIVFESDKGFNLNYISKQENYFIYSINTNGENWDYGRNEIYKYDFKKKISTKLTSEGTYQFAISNEDESKFYFFGNDYEYKFVTLNRLYEFDVKSKKITCLTSDLDVELSDVFVADFQQKTRGFQPYLNNNQIIFSGTSCGKTIVYQIDLDSKELTTLFNQEMHLSDSAFKNDLLVTYSTLNKPSALGIIKKGKLKEIYNPNEEFEKIHQFAEIERIAYNGVFDIPIQGWFVKPIESKKAYPAILYVHGGPQVCFGETFFHEMQVYAAQGYGVMMFNPRGGHGYGQDFVAAILGSYGRNDYEDLMLGVDYITNKYPEIKDLYLTGGSYGGFMTNWIVGMNQRFKRAVTQRSISNWISFYGTSDIGPFFVENQLLCDLSHVDLLWEMSPIKNIENVKTPTLILHGEEDLRCPLEQAQQFYVGLKKHNIETKLITFPKSSHGLSRNGIPYLRMERIQAILDWFKISG